MRFDFPTKPTPHLKITEIVSVTGQGAETSKFM